MKAVYILLYIPLITGSLFAQFTAPVTAEGETLIITGRVLNTDGTSLSEARVEIWQTDAEGIYDHPGDKDTAGRDRGFQFYGSSTTDMDGNYRFRTILPGEYPPRPRHIHVKVYSRSRLVLTTQFYLAPDNRSYGNAPQDLRMPLVRNGGEDADFLGVFDLIVGPSGRKFQPSTSQMEGPYYPVVDVENFDNDLASVN